MNIARPPGSDGVLRPLRGDELDDVAERTVASFGVPDDEEGLRERLASELADGAWWGIEADGRVRGQAKLGLVDHWFGGRKVRCLDLASVAISPGDRGRGVMRGLVSAALSWGHEQRCGLSLLFPATTNAYRQLGWEHAGTFDRWRLDARLTPATGPPLRPAAAAEWSAIVACGRAFAATLDGPAERDDTRWERLRGTRFHWVLDDDEGLAAYALVDHEPIDGDWRHRLAIRDWAALTPAGFAAVLGFVGRHGTTAADATLRGPLPGMFDLATIEQVDVDHDAGFYWMARVLDLPLAIDARGFPPGVSGATTLALDDPVLPAASGVWRLEVADGRGRLEPHEGEPAVRLHTRALGPLFTGFRSPRQLWLAGLAEGDADALAWLGAAFAATPPPLLLDFF